MENKKQTAVEWLESIEMERDLNLGDWRKAKAMEKEQIINACNQTEFEEEDNFGIAENLTKGEQYYKETYEQ
jgi:hypothetical protein